MHQERLGFNQAGDRHPAGPDGSGLDGCFVRNAKQSYGAYLNEVRRAVRRTELRRSGSAALSYLRASGSATTPELYSHG